MGQYFLLALLFLFTTFSCSLLNENKTKELNSETKIPQERVLQIQNPFYRGSFLVENKIPENEYSKYLSDKEINNLIHEIDEHFQHWTSAYNNQMNSFERKFFEYIVKLNLPRLKEQSLTFERISIPMWEITSQAAPEKKAILIGSLHVGNYQTKKLSYIYTNKLKDSNLILSEIPCEKILNISVWNSIKDIIMPHKFFFRMYFGLKYSSSYNNKNFESKNGIDSTIINYAKDHQIKCSNLEKGSTLYETQYLFGKNAFLNSEKRLPNNIIEFVQLEYFIKYYQGNLSIYHAIFNTIKGMEKFLVFDRNKKMAKKIVKTFKTNNRFVIVMGLAHAYSDGESVINLLKNQGYIIKRVKFNG